MMNRTRQKTVAEMVYLHRLHQDENPAHSA
jgi:hypothetical protein